MFFSKLKPSSKTPKGADMSEFKDKVIVITGAASGMGLETAKLLASKGAEVSLADVQGKALNEAAAEIQRSGATVMVTVVDVRNRDQVESWIRSTVSNSAHSMAQRTSRA